MLTKQTQHRDFSRAVTILWTEAVVVEISLTELRRDIDRAIVHWRSGLDGYSQITISDRVIVVYWHKQHRATIHRYQGAPQELIEYARAQWDDKLRNPGFSPRASIALSI